MQKPILTSISEKRLLVHAFGAKCKLCDQKVSSEIGYFITPTGLECKPCRDIQRHLPKFLSKLRRKEKLKQLYNSTVLTIPLERN